MKQPLILLAAILLIFLSNACSTKRIARVALKSIEPAYQFNQDSIPSAPDYASSTNWFLFENDGVKEMDVFFLHPTTYKKADNWNQPLFDSIIYEATIKKSIDVQALLFDSIANIYAPRYRQATFYSFFDSDSNGVKALDIAYDDAKKSFLYYMDHANKNKPIVIAGHSQGSFLAMRLLKDKEVQEEIGDKLVVAYLIGWPVLETDLAEIPYPFCRDSLELSCLTSWNSQKAHSIFSMREYANGIKMYSTNPLSWTTDEEYYGPSYNLGAAILSKDTLIYRPHYIGARNYKGILAIDKPKEKGALNIRRHSGNYHIYDVAFFYRNIQENAKLRKRMYFEKRME